jgi:hypothetical protein
MTNSKLKNTSKIVKERLLFFFSSPKNKKKRIILWSLLGALAAGGIAVGLGVGLSQCHPSSTNINTMIGSTDLDYVSSNDDDAIISAINSKNNTSFSSDDLSVTNKTNTSATVIGRGQYQGSIDITFQISTDINTLVTVTNLDYIVDNNNNTLVDSINLKNGTTFTTSDLSFANKTDTSAIATGQGKYQGHVNITFGITTDINTMITVTNLGYIVNNNDDTLITSINTKNGTNFVTGDLNFTNTDITSVTVIGQNKYCGTLSLTFEISSDINGLITTSNLGYVIDNNDNTLIDVINIKNGTNFDSNDLIFTNKTNVSVAVAGQGKYQGSINLTFVISTDINTLIKTSNLGYMVDNDDNTLITTINTKNNTNFTLGDLTFTNKTTTSVVATGQNQYRGTLNLTFEISANINTLITTTDIGYIANDDDSTLISSINIKNGTTFVAGDLAFTNKTATLVTVTGQSKYQGSVDLTFVISADISVLISITDLGYIVNNDDDTLINSINTKNGTTFTTNDLIFTSKTTTSATVTGQGKYQGTKNLTFVISTDISTLITTTDLGSMANNDDDTLITSINAKNGTTFVASDLAFANKTTTSVIATGLDKYQGTVSLSFNIVVAPYKLDGTNWQGYTAGQIEYYNLDETKGTYTIAMNNQGRLNDYSAVNLVIPSLVSDSNGLVYKVEIGNLAFFGSSSNISGSLTISNGITHIGTSAFQNCNLLTGNLLIPDTIKTIGNSAFKGCTSLIYYEENNINYSVTDATHTHKWCFGESNSSAITDLTLSTGTYGIADYAFNDNTNISGALTIDNDLKIIGTSAFFGCNGITTLYLN